MLTAIVLGVLVGALFPVFGAKLKPIAETFISLIKMLIAPIIFFTVVLGIAGMGSLKKVGRVGGKALLYFEVMTTLALAIGIAVANLTQPAQACRPLSRPCSKTAKVPRKRPNTLPKPAK